MLVLVTYDINTESSEGRKRLRDVARVCMNYGQRVQSSVFECVMDSTQLTQLKLQLKHIIMPELDNIRFYNLGTHYHTKVDTLGASPCLDMEGELIL